MVARGWSRLLWLPVALALAGPAWGQVTILSPREGAELQGSVEVAARVAPPIGERLDRVVVQTEGGNWVRLSPKIADTWSAQLDTTKLRNGRQSLVVIAFVRGADASRSRYEDSAWASQKRNLMAEVQVVVRNPYQWYWGDLHAHTSYSDGSQLPADAYRYARDVAKLDFFAVTDHAQLLTLAEYQDVIAQAQRHDQPGRFVALYGVEYTESVGHLNYYLAPTPRLPSRLDSAYQAIAGMGVLGHFNHPNISSPADQGWKDDFEGFHYVSAADRCMALVEVRNPTEEAAYIALLDAGWHVGAAGCQDQHGPVWGTGGKTWTVALARELTREAVLEALWARRTYSAGDRNLRLAFTVDGEDMGAQIARPIGPLACHVTVADPDPDQVVDRIDLFLDGRIVETTRPKLTSYSWAVPLTFPRGRHYCFVRVTQAGGATTWSSPVWVNAY